jgi:hypothetical protein
LRVAVIVDCFIRTAATAARIEHRSDFVSKPHSGGLCFTIELKAQVAADNPSAGAALEHRGLSPNDGQERSLIWIKSPINAATSHPRIDSKNWHSTSDHFRGSRNTLEIFVHRFQFKNSNDRPVVIIEMFAHFRTRTRPTQELSQNFMIIKRRCSNWHLSSHRRLCRAADAIAAN